MALPRGFLLDDGQTVTHLSGSFEPQLPTTTTLSRNMKRGAEKQLSKDDGDEEASLFYCSFLHATRSYTRKSGR